VFASHLHVNLAGVLSSTDKIRRRLIFQGLLPPTEADPAPQKRRQIAEFGGFAGEKARSLATSAVSCTDA
jgi:hypothetical protein